MCVSTCITDWIGSHPNPLTLTHRRCNITIYDMKHKFIAFTMQLPVHDSVVLMTTDLNVAYIITKTGSIYQLGEQLYIHTYMHSYIHTCILSFTRMYVFRSVEKQTDSKLELLLKKNLYPTAITLAAEETR